MKFPSEFCDLFFLEGLPLSVSSFRYDKGRVRDGIFEFELE